MKTVLVTGAAGYIGKHLCRVLRGHNYKVYGLDIKNDVDMFTPLYQIDISNTFAIPKHPNPLKFDIVIHLAALVRVNESVERPYDYYDTNLNGTHHVLNQIKFDNFIFASTGTASNPINPYALSKRCAEDVVIQYCKNNNKPFSIFRFYNVTGTNGVPATNPDGLFYNLVKAKNEGTFNLYGNDYNTSDGTAIRDYIHVVEVCNALLLAIENSSNKIENLGTGVGRSVLEMVNKFKEVNNCDFKVNMLPRREGDLEKLVLDNPSSYYKQLYSFDELMKEEND
jgi:UDP-glucose 4-epimerase